MEEDDDEMLEVDSEQLLADEQDAVEWLKTISEHLNNLRSEEVFCDVMVFGSDGHMHWGHR